MQTPLIRPGKTPEPAPVSRVVAFFYNSAQGNLAIQLLGTMGIPSDRLGITTPDRIATGQGMILSIGCPNEALIPKVEDLCRRLGAQIHRQRA